MAGPKVIAPAEPLSSFVCKRAGCDYKTKSDPTDPDDHSRWLRDTIAHVRGHIDTEGMP
ncbi:hypothetical protein SEA_OBLADI_83 [Gordonia phage ObLaDi]|uniref:Uncharacterized protein n=3 Tax=Cafassovirus TaxID=3425056 RepID=A0A9E7QEX7_9CAUD|nr:hypothetical protein SEA_CAFASSO_83 [Gordonia phage Cafasso]UVK59822.1 hypothetical protein SEA_ALEEMILY_82 [Gordonia phage Aleemily]UXE03806.1 hypothetical protein SEA_OBLADI_83 [Gordonia phage ObLaDi]